MGQTADGTILLVTAEGPSQGSPGITVADQAALLASLGARTAVAMDAGGSAQLAVGTSLAIPWSSPRSIPDVLLMYYDGVRIEPLPFRISANADRVDDSTTVVMRATRPGVARLTIARRTGRPTKRLWEGRLGPGSVRVLLDPRRIHLADGVYAVVANFTPDDGSGVTEQRRRVILDRTLGSLSARAESRRLGPKVVARLDVGFVLAHSARVSARVESTSGKVLHRLAAGKVMRPGRHGLTWNRRGGGTVVSGSVRVIVEARGRLGTSGLVRAVTLRPPPKPATKAAPPPRQAERAGRRQAGGHGQARPRRAGGQRRDQRPRHPGHAEHGGEGRRRGHPQRVPGAARVRARVPRGRSPPRAPRSRRPRRASPRRADRPRRRGRPRPGAAGRPPGRGPRPAR